MVWSGKCSDYFPDQTFSFCMEKREGKMTEEPPVTVDAVRDAQDNFKNGATQHENKTIKRPSQLLRNRQ